MKSNDTTAISNFLSKRNDYAECVIHSLAILDFGTTIRIQLDYIWDSKGAIRQDLAEPLLVTLFFRLTQRFCMHNHLNQTQVLHADDLNWGVNEIAAMKVIQDSELTQKFSHPLVPYTHIALLWESGRRMDIVFSELEVIEPHNLQGDGYD